MFCPFCKAMDTKVIDSRIIKEGGVRRRRTCLDCDARFTTYETAELSMPRVVKRDQTRVNYDHAKIKAGIMRALEKRPVSTADIDNTLSAINERVRAFGEKEISAEQIGAWVMAALRQLDDVAYVRFASVYRQFKDLDAFKAEIERLIQSE